MTRVHESVQDVAMEKTLTREGMRRAALDGGGATSLSPTGKPLWDWYCGPEVPAELPLPCDIFRSILLSEAECPEWRVDGKRVG